MRAGRRVAVALLLIVSAALGSGCSAFEEGEAVPSGESPPSPHPDATATPSPTEDSGSSTVRWAVQALEHVVPGDATTRDELLVVSALYEPLTRLDAAGRPRAALAESWESTEDGRRWRFHLSPDARFVGATDGSARRVVADDLVFAWERAAAEGRAGFLLREVAGYERVAEGDASELAGVEAVDDTTLEVELSRPNAAFDIVVSHPSLAPLPEDAWRDDARAQREKPIGNGPFRMAEAIVPGDFIRVQPVESWHRGEPQVDEVLFRTMDTDSAYVAFQQGRLDVGPVPEDALGRARSEYGRARTGGLGGGLLTDPVPDLLALGVNVRAEPFDSVEVRRALSLAVDRSALARSGAAGADAPASSLLLPGLPEGGDGRCAHCRHDTAAAATIFAAHDVDELTLWVDEEGSHAALNARLRRDLAAAGVSLRVEQLPFDEWVAALRDGDAPLFRLGWAPEHRTGLDVLGPLVHSEGIWNHTALADDELDQLIEDARTASSRVEREAALRAAESRALERAAIIPLARGEHRTIIAERITGLRLDALSRADLSGLGLDRDAVPAP